VSSAAHPVVAHGSVLSAVALILLFLFVRP
jgi:hypothetical protein